MDLAAEGRNSKMQPHEVYANAVAYTLKGTWQALATRLASGAVSGLGKASNPGAEYDKGVSRKPLIDAATGLVINNSWDNVKPYIPVIGAGAIALYFLVKRR